MRTAFTAALVPRTLESVFVPHQYRSTRSRRILYHQSRGALPFCNPNGTPMIADTIPESPSRRRTFATLNESEPHSESPLVTDLTSTEADSSSLDFLHIPLSLDNNLVNGAEAIPIAWETEAAPAFTFGYKQKAIQNFASTSSSISSPSRHASQGQLQALNTELVSRHFASPSELQLNDKGASSASTRELSHGLHLVSPHLPRVLVIHCGGTFAMQLAQSQGQKALNFSSSLPSLLQSYPELNEIARLDVQTPMKLDSSRMGPDHWVKIAKLLHKQRDLYNGFVIIHGTDTMSYTGAALSLMLAGFRKPVVLTGSQRPMLMAQSDARQNLIDAVTVVSEGVLQEFGICFGGLLLRANRSIKSSSSAYRAFASPTHPPLAVLGVDIEWNHGALWKDPGVYRPHINLNPKVIRIPVVPGSNPTELYGNLYNRGVRGVVIESFGVGNLPDQRSTGWTEWLRSQQKLGLKVYLTTQCSTGPLNPNLYNTSAAEIVGATSTKRMTTETAVVKMMLCLAHPNLHMSFPLAGEL